MAVVDIVGLDVADELHFISNCVGPRKRSMDTDPSLRQLYSHCTASNLDRYFEPVNGDEISWEPRKVHDNC